MSLSQSVHVQWLLGNHGDIAGVGTRVRRFLLQTTLRPSPSWGASVEVSPFRSVFAWILIILSFRYGCRESKVLQLETRLARMSLGLPHAEVPPKIPTSPHPAHLIARNTSQS